MVFWQSDARLDTPDLQTCQVEFPIASAENAATASLCLSPGGRGSPAWCGRRAADAVRLTGADPGDPVEIEANMLSHPDDMKAAVAAVELCRESAIPPSLRPFVKREVMPGDLSGDGARCTTSAMPS